MPGREPAWNWNWTNGRLERNSKGGIDWWRYNKVSFLPNPIEYSTNSYQEVLVLKLIPFAKECMVERPNTIVLEDGAPAHRHHFQASTYQVFKMQKIMD